MSATTYRRVVYRSRARDGAGNRDLAGILTQSRSNNGIDGLSGLLWTDGTHYVQLLEGPPESVATTLRRILADPRHEQFRFLSDAIVDVRAFGDWTMANLPGDRETVPAERMRIALDGAPPDVQALFVSLAAA